MSVRTFFRAVGVLFLCGAVWGVYLLMHQWNEQHIGEFDVRHNSLTGAAQIKVNGDWVVPFDNDQFAPPLSPTDLKRVRLLDVTWGRGGLLCARALVAPGPAVKGRMAFRIAITDVVWKKRITERELRETVDWPGGSLTSFVLRTGMTAPTEKNERTFVTLQPTLYSGE